MTFPGPNGQETMLSDNTREKYYCAYKKFKAWAKQREVTSHDENVFLAYFNGMSLEKQPSTLWSVYSMLKMTFKWELDVDISNFTKLTAFLRHKSKGYQPKKCNVFTPEEVQQFLQEAPDEKFLATKVK